MTREAAVKRENGTSAYGAGVVAWQLTYSPAPRTIAPTSTAQPALDPYRSEWSCRTPLVCWLPGPQWPSKIYSTVHLNNFPGILSVDTSIFSIHGCDYCLQLFPGNAPFFGQQTYERNEVQV